MVVGCKNTRRADSSTGWGVDFRRVQESGPITCQAYVMWSTLLEYPNKFCQGEKVSK